MRLEIRLVTDDEIRAVFRLYIDPSDIFTDDAEREELHAAKKEQTRNYGEVAGFINAVYHYINKHVQNICKRDQQYAETEMKTDAQRSVVIGADAIDGIINQLQRVEA